MDNCWHCVHRQALGAASRYNTEACVWKARLIQNAHHARVLQKAGKRHASSFCLSFKKLNTFFIKIQGDFFKHYSFLVPDLHTMFIIVQKINIPLFPFCIPCFQTVIEFWLHNAPDPHHRLSRRSQVCIAATPDRSQKRRA